MGLSLLRHRERVIGMAKIIVTGAAGFIGSHLCEELLRNHQHDVVGIDAFIDLSTPTWIRKRNLQHLLENPRFTFFEDNLLTVPWEQILHEADVVYHLAGMPGVRSSWGPDFVHYTDHNITATQRLLEGCKQHGIKRFLFASTSSIYGEKSGKVDESATTFPLSPYGITKLTSEHLCRVYYENDGLPVVILRFFTVYGPRQRPDMAFHRFIKQMFDREEITLYGDGTQSRDFTYISDCVRAVVAAGFADEVIGETINIGGKERATINECIALLEHLFQYKASIKVAGGIYGEPTSTWADITKAERLLGYSPAIDLETGLLLEIEHLKKLYQYVK
ncbi:NAD-dependent epimerase/dehydratase family protein [Paenibacillus sp. UMB4589-SE434]|uniref:NAD-dependent epimerase/dehydratase family protein n=1 Tax=Paenibacillus sp. UMB4589-SE434 TaxID=3046314 RepID=UPI00254DB535|nr:NAD-dependent epimerase/dehydratase family protein [Paenibacillus sp. UMB4589-SE434]MDK8182250.1 NAD-dependent epimerase/dehydratase family protein [Paenibacillus sp. UMB4589-SE434]